MHRDVTNTYNIRKQQGVHSIRYKIDKMSLEGLDHVLQIEGTRVTKQKKRKMEREPEGLTNAEKI